MQLITIIHYNHGRNDDAAVRAEVAKRFIPDAYREGCERIAPWFTEKTPSRLRLDTATNDKTPIVEVKMKEWLLVLKAADAAARWHVHHRRKGPAEEPYINHLLEVAMLVAEATDGTDTNLVIAALLHDAIEDSEVPRELIAETFGDDVASIVAEVTDDKSLPKAKRKLIQVETASTKSPRAKILKLADKTSNLRAVAASPPSDWSVKRRIEYVEFARKVALGLRGVNIQLEQQFCEAAQAADRSFRPAL